jgi:hypothetical protein
MDASTYSASMREICRVSEREKPNKSKEGSRPDPANGIAQKRKNAYQRGKASRRPRLRRGGYAPDLASSRAKWNPPKNRLPKMPKDTFSVGVRYHDPTGKARALRTEIRRRIRKLPVRATAAK